MNYCKIGKENCRLIKTCTTCAQFVSVETNPLVYEINSVNYVGDEAAKQHIRGLLSVGIDPDVVVYDENDNEIDVCKGSDIFN